MCETIKSGNPIPAFRARGDKVRPAEGGKEIEERFFVGQIDHRKPQTPLIAVAVKQVVVSYARTKQVPRSNSRRILVGTLCSIGGNVYTRGSVRSASGATGEWRV
jgi:hypothetical protein